MGIFDGILFCTDLDGTIIGKGGTVSEENREAIEYFKSEGGKFTFITGRMPFFVESYYNAIKPNAPFGCVNGAGVYDWEQKKYIWTGAVHDSVCELIRAIDEKFPTVGIQVNTFYRTYFCKDNVTMQHFRASTNLENLVCHYTEVKDPIGKIIFGSEDDGEILEIEKALRSHPKAEDFDFTRSEMTLFEILPKGIGKGTAIERIAEYLNIDMSKTIAIGDYNNDISMFRAAKLGIAVANACDDAKAAADLVTVSNLEHAVARVIYDLRDGKITL